MVIKRFWGKFVCINAVLFLIVYYFCCVLPLLTNNLKLNAEKKVFSAINVGISKTLTQNNFLYDNIIKIEYDLAGNVSTIKTNINEINTISSILSDETEKHLTNPIMKNVTIKLGCLSGVSFLAGVGPNINFNIDNVDYVHCEFNSKFTSQGINQTLHSIYINVHAVCGIVIPFKKIKIDQYQQFLVCETVIVGKIPEVYLFSDNLDSLYNFVPIQ